MKQFTLEKYLENPQRKVVTRDGRPVRIVCTDLKNNHPIIAAIKGDNNEMPYYYDINGKCLFYDSKDLFFADEEEEPQSIEIPFGAKDSEFIKDEYYIPEGCEARIEGNKVIIEKIQKEEELTEFDYAVLSIISDHNSHTDSIEAFAKRSSKKLLAMARKEMMKDAVGGQVVYQIGSAEIAPTDIRYKVVSDRVYIPNVKLGDKVKIIILKEEQQ